MIGRPIPWAALAWDAFCLVCIAVVVILVSAAYRDAARAEKPTPASLRAPECRPLDQVWREVREHSDPRRRVG